MDEGEDEIRLAMSLILLKYYSEKIECNRLIYICTSLIFYTKLIKIIVK